MSEEANFPVFVQPSELNFIVSKAETHKKILTVYNPYEFALKFVVLSNAPTKYRVVEPRGFIRPKCYVDIMVRHLSPTIAAVGLVDCLRIEIFREGDVSSCGRKDLSMNVLTVDPSRSSTMDEDQFIAFPSGSAIRGAGTSKPQRHVSFDTNPAGFPAPAPGALRPGAIQIASFYWVFLICFFACVVTLMLPTYDGSSPATNPSSSPYSLSAVVPAFLRPTHTLQLVAAYALGLLTLYLIHPT